MSKSSFLRQASTIPYKLIDNQDTEFVQDLIDVEKLYSPSDSKCNDGVACLTDVSVPQWK